MQGPALSLDTAMPPPAEEIERLFTQHHQRVFQAAYRVTGSVDDAEDVLQTVFARLLAPGARRDLSPNPAGYLHRAAIHAALDTVRARGSRKTVPLELVASDGVPARGLDPERQRGEGEARERLRVALGAVAPRTAEMFVLKYVEGCDNREIAAIVGTSPGVVAVSLFRARRTVRRLFVSGPRRSSEGRPNPRRRPSE